MHDLVISNGLVLMPGGPQPVSVGVTGGRITAVGTDLAGDRSLDAAGCYVMPGGVDAHVHLEMALDGRVTTDDFASGTLAAVCGGTTAIVDFVNPEPEESLLHALDRRRAAAAGRVHADYGLHMTLPSWHANRPDMPAEILAVYAAGCATFKLYQAYDGMMLDDPALLRVMQAVAEAGGRVVLHSEAGPVIDLLREQARAAGHTQPIWHNRTRPAALEGSAVQRAAVLAGLADCPLHIFHISCREALDAVRSAATSGSDISGETCPQYLLLTAEEHLGGATGERYICAPPLRTHEDQEALWAALADGGLSMVTTDHCPWTLDEKAQPDFTQAPGGVPSIEARVALLHTYGVQKNRLTLERWVEVCATAPAAWMGLASKGRIAPGYDADIVLFDPAREGILDAGHLHERAGWTPYVGLRVEGWPRTVLLRGEPVVVDEEPVGPPAGRFIPRG